MPDLSFKKVQALVALALLLFAAAPPGMAAGSAAGSAASSASTSLKASSAGISTSIEKSSDSSSKDKKVAEGDYRIIDIAAVAEQPGMLRLRLLASEPGADGEFFLLLPKAVADDARLAEGNIVTARHRPYGLEFAHGEPRQAFFLALTDAWIRELQTTVVAL